MGKVGTIFETGRKLLESTIVIYDVYSQYGSAAGIRKMLISFTEQEQSFLAFLDDLAREPDPGAFFEDVRELPFDLETFELPSSIDAALNVDGFMKELINRERLLYELFGYLAERAVGAEHRAALERFSSESLRRAALVQDRLDLQAMLSG